jgi:hypothetical protein
MRQFILQENVLSDNILIAADKGKAFKGGYIAFIKEYSFQSAWTDKESVVKFKSEKQLHKYLAKKYPEFDYCLYDT